LLFSKSCKETMTVCSGSRLQRVVVCANLRKLQMSSKASRWLCGLPDEGSGKRVVMLVRWVR
jgi:hypothetical protein